MALVGQDAREAEGDLRRHRDAERPEEAADDERRVTPMAQEALHGHLLYRMRGGGTYRPRLPVARREPRGPGPPGAPGVAIRPPGRARSGYAAAGPPGRLRR